MKMTEIQKIRHAFFMENMNKHQIAKKFHRSWETVDRIIETSLEDLEATKERNAREVTVGTLEVKEAIKQMLQNEKDLKIKKKQRLTSRVIYKELTEKKLYIGSLRRLEQLVKEARISLGTAPINSYLQLNFPLGSCLQVDHGEVEVEKNSQILTVFLFVAGVPGTTLRYAQVFPRKSKEMWGEFHERAFRAYGGVFKKLVYDNDTVLISNVKIKQETNFAEHLVDHYKFEPHYCNPASGNEKGTVENSVGCMRRNYFAGRRQFKDFKDINQMLHQVFVDAVEMETCTRKGRSLKELMEEIKQNLSPIPPTKQWVRKEDRVVNSYQQILVDDHFYSVPEKYVGRCVKVWISCFKITIILEDEKMVIHERKFLRDEDSLYWDHYLEQLEKKPGALWDVRVMQDLKASDSLIDKVWALITEKRSLREAQKEFIQILLLHRTYGLESWYAALAKVIKLKHIGKGQVEALLKLDGEKEEENTATIEAEIKGKYPHLSTKNVEFSTDQYNSLCGEFKC